jgi:hypothetical protein
VELWANQGRNNIDMQGRNTLSHGVELRYAGGAAVMLPS